ncbi:hypothetical protein FUA23_18295 [Neolewinella aurantiaca]|uniref:Piwi domain-containing protein n=1 Tax=Neolewinella aurantiaca TaxID=2602767 RepID=A0A5C7F9V0_9BACT|nr:hypothetical protein [Neolewinella aurantiaca]TXF87541.1 hypothetical protein FUA23_18295 [Neolewinella aurantiaca]
MESNLYKINVQAESLLLYSYTFDEILTFDTSQLYVKTGDGLYVSNIRKGNKTPIPNRDNKYFNWLVKKFIIRSLRDRSDVIDINNFRGEFTLTSDPLHKGKEFSILRRCSFRIQELYNEIYLLVDLYTKVYNRISLRDLLDREYLPIDYVEQNCKKCLVYVELEGKRRWVYGQIIEIKESSVLVSTSDSPDDYINIGQERVLPSLRTSDYENFETPSSEVEALRDLVKKTSLSNSSDKHRHIDSIVNNVFFSLFENSDNDSFKSLSVNPLTIPESNILSISNQSLPKYLISRQGKTITSERLMAGLSKFDLKDNIVDENVVVFFRESDKEDMRDLLKKLNTGIISGNFSFSLPTKFGIKLNVVKHYEISKNTEYISSVFNFLQSSNSDFVDSLVIIYLPPNSADYYNIKALLASHGRVSQIVSKTNFDIYSCWNISANIYAKLGYTPWSIESKADDFSDLVLGLSYSSLKHNGRLKRNLGHVNVFDRNGIWKYMKSSINYLNFEERQEEMPRLILNAVADYQSTNPNLRSIDIHYTKKFSAKERNKVMRALESQPIECVNFISLNKGHSFHLFDSSRSTKVVGGGKIVILGKNRFLLSTSVQSNSDKIFEITVWINGTDCNLSEDEILKISTRILSMTKLNWKSAVKLTSDPVTTKFSSEVAKLTNYFDLTSWREVSNSLSNVPWFI